MAHRSNLYYEPLAKLGIVNLERAFKWLGGALFVGAIVWTALWYALVLGQPHGWSGWGPPAYDALLFSVFAAHHSLFAREGLKAALARRLPEQLLRSVYVWTASALLILVSVFWQTVGGEVYRHIGAAWWLHAAVQLIGVWMIARSVGAIDPLELAGIRAGSPGRLQMTGPYRLVRHPLYLGWMLGVCGPAQLTGDRLAFAAITSLYLVMAMPWEERALERALGAQYASYKQQVRWKLVPYVF